jgi:glycosyltransferase involved in cell wall biosynthesis
MPFIGMVIKQVIPYVDRCLITMSLKADKDTFHRVIRLAEEYPGKVQVDYENVSKPGELTGIRQRQLDRTIEDWVLFLDDDDYWPDSSIKKIKELIELNEDVDAYSFNPLQVINHKHHDISWKNKWFTKLFKNQPGVHYENPWPRDLIYKGNEMLYWKKNDKVINKDIPFYHLSYVKDSSFRNEDWAKEFKNQPGVEGLYSAEQQKEVDKIFNDYIWTY